MSMPADMTDGEMGIHDPLSPEEIPGWLYSVIGRILDGMLRYIAAQRQMDSKAWDSYAKREQKRGKRTLIQRTQQ